MISLKNTLKALTTACAKIKDITIGSNYIIIGDVGICWSGWINLTNNITFPITYQDVPNLQLTMLEPDAASARCFVYVTNLTKQGATLTGRFANQFISVSNAGEKYCWVAIGKV